MIRRKETPSKAHDTDQTRSIWLPNLLIMSIHEDVFFQKRTKLNISVFIIAVLHLTVQMISWVIHTKDDPLPAVLVIFHN